MKNQTIEGAGLGQRVSNLRIRREVTQIELARAIGVSATAISKLESGETRMLRADHLLRIAIELGGDPVELCFGLESEEYRHYSSALPAIDGAAARAGVTLLSPDKRRLLARIFEVFLDEAEAGRQRSR
ncbi:transcriptional regulator with XRE-family HTH domain [Paraburkholderia atlantica]|uniref:helix-turn-helix domain-containing protein n=1 Tax=Paraburkholderia atlantica TaxID=2654982 RepID=UPI003D20FCF0